MLTLLLSVVVLWPDSPTPMPLWPGKAPHAVGDDPKDQPSLTAWLPAKEKANGTAVVICPGGGYSGLADDHEGKDPATWLNERGITAFVLKYRTVGPKRPGPLHPAPLMDAQRAIRMVRSKAKEFGIDAKKVGIWGFSAGGHLASSAATHFDNGQPEATDAIDKESCRPDFAILSYPVISMKPPVTHGGSRNNLLGSKADEKLVEDFSNDQAVTKDTPPTFLFHTSEDTAVKPENSVLFYMALRKHNIPAELHIYEKGKHGVGLARMGNNKDSNLSTWTDRLDGWLKVRGFLPK